MDRHVTRNHTDHPIFDCGQCERSFARSGNLEKHKRTCTGGDVVVPVAAPATKKRRIAVSPEFKLRKPRNSLGGATAQFTVNMKEARYLSALTEAIAVFAPVIPKFHSVDSAVVTQPPVTLTSEMVAVHSDAVTPLEDVNRQLLNFIEVYEHNGSCWVFSNCASL